MIDLNVTQRDRLSDLMSSGRLRAVSPDPERAAVFLAHAQDGIRAATQIPTAHVAFDVAYNSAHDSGEALMAALGVRPGRSDGAHATVGQVLVVMADDSPFAPSARAYDAIRQTRNRVRYDAGHVGIAQATHACRIAGDLLAFVTQMLDASGGDKT